MPAVALASVLGPIAARMAGATEASTLATLVMATALTTLFIGAAALALGTFKLGRFIRSAPFPVIGGFLAGSGWLILYGGLDLIAGRNVLLDPLGAVSDPAFLPKIAFTSVFIIAVVGLGRVTRVRLAVPATVVAAVILFDAAMRLAGISADALRQAGWLMQLPQKGMLWHRASPAGNAVQRHLLHRERTRRGGDDNRQAEQRRGRPHRQRLAYSREVPRGHGCHAFRALG